VFISVFSSIFHDRKLKLDEIYFYCQEVQISPSFLQSSIPPPLTLEEIAAGAQPYGHPGGYPYGVPQPMYYPPQGHPGAYPPHPMGYPGPVPPYAGGMMPVQQIAHEAATLSTSYPLPVPKPVVDRSPVQYSPVLPAKPAAKPSETPKASKFLDAPPVSFTCLNSLKILILF
jgi:hypothetical protein